MSGNTSETSVLIAEGFPVGERDAIARMYWAAFGAKLGAVLAPREMALAMLAEAFDPAHAIVARSVDGRLLGVAGYKTAQGSFAAIGFNGLRRHFGLAGALWRGSLLSLLDRGVDSGTLLMDGIFVDEAARGQGVGALLLTAVKRKAQAFGCPLVRLDVIDTNPRARLLYEREGFRPVGTRNYGPLRHVFGFRSATTMVADSRS